MLDSPVPTAMVPLPKVVAPSAVRVDQAILLAADVKIWSPNSIQFEINSTSSGLQRIILATSKPIRIRMLRLRSLREYFEEILEQPGVVGLSIATRPDCLPDDVVDYLAELNERTYLWVEMGLQTIHDSTSTLINRAHDTKCYEEAVEKLRKRNIRVCTHIIYGLPQETHEMMLDTGRAVANMDVQGIKIHLLHLMRKTPMVKQYEAGLLRFWIRTSTSN